MAASLSSSRSDFFAHIKAYYHAYKLRSGRFAKAYEDLTPSQVYAKVNRPFPRLPPTMVVQTESSRIQRPVAALLTATDANLNTEGDEPDRVDTSGRIVYGKRKIDLTEIKGIDDTQAQNVRDVVEYLYNYLGTMRSVVVRKQGCAGPPADCETVKLVPTNQAFAWNDFLVTTDSQLYHTIATAFEPVWTPLPGRGKPTAVTTAQLRME